MRKIIIFCLFLYSFANAQEKLNLNQCVDLAIERNPEMELAKMERKSAKAGIKGSYSNILPEVSTGVEWSKRNQGEREYYVGGVEQIQPETSSESFGAGIYYNQNLYDGGGWWNKIKLAKNKHKTSSINKKQVKQNLMAAVRKQYYKILKAKKMLNTYESSLKNSKERLKKVKEMYEIGQVAKKDYLKAKVQKGNDRLNVIQQERQIKILKNHLAKLMGYRKKQFVVVEEKYESPQNYKIEPSVQKAYNNNTGLKTLEYQKKNYNLQYNIAKSNYLPTLSANMRYSRGGSRATRLYSDFDKFWNTSVGLNLSIPLFQGFRTRTNIQQAKIRYKQYNPRIKQKKQEINQNIRDLIENLDSYNEMLEVNEVNLESAKEDLRSAQEMYEVESATILEVLKAQANFTQAKSNLIRTKYDAKIAETELKYYMGTL